MSKGIFISLPVADVARSTAFYEAIGFTRDEAFSNEACSALKWSDTISFMVAGHAFYGTLTPKTIADTHTTSAALFALSLDSRDAVDSITAAAIAAGGREVHDAEDMGFMYSRAFEDFDGHGFGPFHIDEAAAATAQA